MLAALQEWYDQQSRLRQSPHENIESDIADIRNLVIRPNGDGVLSRFAGNTFSRRRPSVPFVIVNPDVSVKLSRTENARQTVYQTLPGVDPLLFLNAEQQAILTTIVATLGDGRADTADGRLNDTLALWNKFFPTERRFGGTRRQLSSHHLRDIPDHHRYRIPRQRTHKSCGANRRRIAGRHGCPGKGTRNLDCRGLVNTGSHNTIASSAPDHQTARRAESRRYFGGLGALASRSGSPHQ